MIDEMIDGLCQKNFGSFYWKIDKSPIRGEMRSAARERRILENEKVDTGRIC
jgi:hypothetical protein